VLPASASPAAQLFIQAAAFSSSLHILHLFSFNHFFYKLFYPILLVLPPITILHSHNLLKMIVPTAVMEAIAATASVAPIPTVVPGSETIHVTAGAIGHRTLW